MTSEGGSSYGSRGLPPNTTGRAVPLAGISEGVLGGRLQARHRGSTQACSGINVHNDHGPTINVCGHNSAFVSKLRRSNDKACENSHNQEELSSRLEEVECGRHKPPQVSCWARLYTTGLRLHQRRLNSTFIFKLLRSNGKAIEGSHEQDLSSNGWKMLSAAVTSPSSLVLGLDSTPQVYAYTNRG